LKSSDSISRLIASPNVSPVRGSTSACPPWPATLQLLHDLIEAQAWLADVLAKIADTPKSRLTELLPWNWKAAREINTAA